MASIKYGAMVVGIAGKIGGTVFRRGKATSVASNIANKAVTWSSPYCYNIALWGRLCITLGHSFDLGRSISNKKLWAYKAINNPTYTATLWRSLTLAQRDTWVAGAINFPAKNKFGDTYTPSGFQVYNALNSNLYGIHLTTISECPAVLSIPACPGILIVATANGLINVALDTAIPAEFVLQIRASNCFSKGRRRPPSGYINFAMITPLAGTNFDLSEYFADKRPLPLLGSRIAFQYRLLSSVTGQAGPWQNQASDIIAASTLTVSFSLTVTRIELAIYAEIVTNSTNAVALDVFALTPPSFPTTSTFKYSPTVNTPITHLVLITEDTVFLLRATAADGTLQDSFLTAFIET